MKRSPKEEREREARALWCRVYAVAKLRGCADDVAKEDANEAVRRYRRRFR